jgi:chromosome partitioning protein
MQITAVVNQKGGVGKTTTTINVGRALARVGRRVLLVDLDEQGALTFHFLGVEAEEFASLFDVIGTHGEVSLEEAIVSSEVANIDVMPANDDLALLNNDLVVSGGDGASSRLARALGAVAADYDDVLIDCPPSLSLLTVNALVAAHQVLIVTEPELYSGRGVGKLLNTIDSIRDQLNPLLSVAGVLINKYDKGEEIHVRRAAEIREQLTAGDPPILVMPTVVPRWTTVMRTADAGAGVADFTHPAARRLLNWYQTIARALDPNVPEPGGLHRAPDEPTVEEVAS